MEMDPWVVSDVLRPNLESTGFLDVSVIHTVRVETFLKNAERFVGDYILSLYLPYMIEQGCEMMYSIQSMVSIHLI